MRTCVFILVSFLLVGCANPKYEQAVDQSYVNAIDKEARQRGSTVIWLSYPTARQTAKPAPQS
ncbi:hypothetical protein [Chitinimonas sp. BJB300]|uniref:hypothetical protein n=1 Tax=Chitinimonas sp. BJB300 TaxID=1559339 RepID=UPI000C10E842|nr:hypothetical protein [Chitinimonas sp. BJB300]PHV12382.1 hypothetical protein CSQ89_06190 [Chitinimonas sp. BJB300]TSJ91093.1 hypothetical protein FG002_001975 [Chitinimonas sp. BJB300]